MALLSTVFKVMSTVKHTIELNCHLHPSTLPLTKSLRIYTIQKSYSWKFGGVRTPPASYGPGYPTYIQIDFDFLLGQKKYSVVKDLHLIFTKHQNI